MSLRRLASLTVALGVSVALAASVQGAGAGGGGAPPDLVLTKRASRTTALVGDQVVFYVTVSLKPDQMVTQTATQVMVTDELPSGLTVISTYADRGPGCSGTTVLSCNLDFLFGAVKATITIVTRVNQTGALVNRASVRSSESDPDLSNNSASATVTVSTPAPPPPPVSAGPPPAPPRLVRSGPAVLRATRAGESTFRLFVGEAATVVVRGVDPRTGRKLTLVPPSRLGAKKIGTAASTLKATTDRARVFRTKLRFRGLVREKLYRITVQATDRDGQRSTLSIPLRG